MINYILAKKMYIPPYTPKATMKKEESEFKLSVTGFSRYFFLPSLLVNFKHHKPFFSNLEIHSFFFFFHHVSNEFVVT